MGSESALLKTKALVCLEVGKPYSLQDVFVDQNELDDDQVIVQFKASGIWWVWSKRTVSSIRETRLMRESVLVYVRMQPPATPIWAHKKVYFLMLFRASWDMKVLV